MSQHPIQPNKPKCQTKEYVPKEAEVIARLMASINDNVIQTRVTGVAAVFGLQYVIQKVSKSLEMQQGLVQ